MNDIGMERSHLPSFKCHKVVKAWYIRAWYAADHQPEMRVIYLENGPNGEEYSPIVVPETMFARYTPVPGDVFVVYDDSYQSISPRKAFDDGYSQITAQEA